MGEEEGEINDERQLVDAGLYSTKQVKNRDRYREKTHIDKKRTEQRIHRGYIYRADDTQSEQRIHRGYTYRAEDTLMIHIRS